MKVLVHINILEDFITKRKYTHKGNRMLIGSSTLTVRAAFPCSGFFRRGLHRRCVPWERRGTWSEPWRSRESCAGVRAQIYPTCVKRNKLSSERAGWKSYTCYRQPVLSKLTLWTWKSKTWPLSACQYLGDNTYSSDSHCTENVLPQADIVLAQWISSPKTLVRWCLLWDWQSHYRNAARAASL